MQLITNRFQSFVSTSGSSVAFIKAADTEGYPMVFSLDSSVDDLLQIDNTGNLTLKKELDREVSWKRTITFPRMQQIAREIGEMTLYQFEIWRQRNSVAISPLILIKRKLCTPVQPAVLSRDRLDSVPYLLWA